MIGDPFPNNIIPLDRIFNPDGSYKNPMMDLYSRMVPTPNQNFIDNGQQPTGNFYQGGQPDSPKSHQGGGRIDFNASDTDRFFFRGSANTFIEYVSDWSYLAPDPRTAHPVGGSLALPVVVEQQLDAREGPDARRHAGRHQPVQPDRQIPRDVEVQSDRRGPAGVPGRVLREQRRLHAAGDYHCGLPGHGERLVERRYGDAHAGPVDDFLG
jgi:hypothetical protein